MGVISIADTVRDKAKETIHQLKVEGIDHLVMLTGDNRHTADIVAKQLNMDRMSAELLPEDKAKKVKHGMGKDINLATLGDGVDQAPASATAPAATTMG